MKAAILDAITTDSMVSTTLQAYLVQRQVVYSWYTLQYLKILPCRSCNTCAIRTPGECFQNDDMRLIVHSLAASELLIYLTPITYGGYSSLLKKAIDRSMPLGEASYIVQKGHLLHPMRYGRKYILAVGFSNGDSEEEANFNLLVSRNALNMQSSHSVVIIRPGDRLKDWAYGIDLALIKAAQL